MLCVGRVAAKVFEALVAPATVEPELLEVLALAVELVRNILLLTLSAPLVAGVASTLGLSPAGSIRDVLGATSTEVSSTLTCAPNAAVRDSR